MKPPIRLCVLVASAAMFLNTTMQSGNRAAEPVVENVAAEVDRLLTEEVFNRASGCELAPRTNDELYLRRVYLDLIGENPGPNDVCTFVLDPDEHKRAAVTARLLADPRFGRNWARYWRDVIMYRRSSEQALFAAVPLETYLTEQLNNNVGWDKIARSFVEAKGEVYENGQAAVFMAQLAEPVDVASETSRIFLGIQIQCAQCHDHPTDRWKREQFHEFAAFFPRAGLKPVMTGMRRGFEVASFDTGPQARRPGMFGTGALEHFMPDLKNPSSRGDLMTPVFFANGQRLNTGATDAERRQSLAEWMTSPDNPWFAKAFVNRLWAELVGEGFYEPVDDLGPDRQCSAPQTLELLATQFVTHGYDVKWLVQMIMGTEAYQRVSRPKRNPDQPPFTANVSYRLRSDQLFDVLIATTGIDPDAGAARNATQAMGPRPPAGARFQFSQLFGYDPSLRRDGVTTSIPQALMLMNSFQVNRAVNARQNNTELARQLATIDNNEQVVVELYLRCLAREPNPPELAVCLDHLRDTTNRAESFEDIYWSLLNSKEFIDRK